MIAPSRPTIADRLRSHVRGLEAAAPLLKGLAREDMDAEIATCREAATALDAAEALAERVERHFNLPGPNDELFQDLCAAFRRAMDGEK